MKNNILFIVATHGDEQLGVEVLQKLSRERKDFDWIIGNEEAFRRGTRFFEKDLNRCGRGKKESTIYEERRALEIQKLVQNYDYTIDLHGAKNMCGIFTIVTNPTKKNLALASLLPIKNIVIWPSITKEMQSPMSEFFPCGVEIECGDKYSVKTSEKLFNIISKTIDLLKTKKPSQKTIIKTLKNKNIYQMIGDIKKSEIKNLNELEEFKEIELNGQKITSLFVGTYDYSDIVAYKLKKLDAKEITHKYLRE